jgi:hypothetical protein
MQLTFGFAVTLALHDLKRIAGTTVYVTHGVM